MGMIAGVLERALPLEGPYPLTTARLVEALGGKPSAAGVTINPETALGIAAVYSAVRVITDALAALPLPIYRQLARGKERAYEHPLYELLHDAPNPHMTAFQFIETLQGHLLLWGNAYASIERNGLGQILGLWPLRPNDMVKVERSASNDLIYTYNLPRGGGPVTIPQRDMFHIRGFSPDGILGYAPMRLHREPLGLSKATEEYAARFFSNSAEPRGVLQAKSRLSDGAIARLRDSWNAAHQGLTNAHRVAVLEEGVEWHQIAGHPSDAQLDKSRQFQLEEVSRVMRVPPHKVADLARSTYSNIASQRIEFVVDTLVPWTRRWAQQINLSLLTRQERRQYFAEFLLDGLLRGDPKQRSDMYTVLRNSGAISANEIREFEGLNPIDGGDEYWQPVNMQVVGAPAPEPDEPEPTDEEEDAAD